MLDSPTLQDFLDRLRRLPDRWRYLERNQRRNLIAGPILVVLLIVGAVVFLRPGPARPSPRIAVAPLPPPTEEERQELSEYERALGAMSREQLEEEVAARAQDVRRIMLGDLSGDLAAARRAQDRAQAELDRR